MARAAADADHGWCVADAIARRTIPPQCAFNGDVKSAVLAGQFDDVAQIERCLIVDDDMTARTTVLVAVNRISELLFAIDITCRGARECARTSLPTARLRGTCRCRRQEEKHDNCEMEKDLTHSDLLSGR